MMAEAKGVLQGQTAIVTGGNRGIGKGIARAFAMAGADVLVTARDAALLESTVAELEAYGGVVVGVPADVQVEADVARVFAEAAAIGSSGWTSWSTTRASRCRRRCTSWSSIPGRRSSGRI